MDVDADVEDNGDGEPVGDTEMDVDTTAMGNPSITSLNAPTSIPEDSSERCTMLCGIYHGVSRSQCTHVCTIYGVHDARMPCTYACDSHPLIVGADYSVRTLRDTRNTGWDHPIGALYDGDPAIMPLPCGAKSWEKAPLPDTYVLVSHDRTSEGYYTEALKRQIRHKVAQAMELTYDIRQRAPRSWHINRESLNRPSITDWAGSQVYTMPNDDFETPTDRIAPALVAMVTGFENTNPTDATLVEMD